MDVFLELMGVFVLGSIVVACVVYALAKLLERDW